MSDDLSVGAVVEHARGVLAERFGVGISTADSILKDVAVAQRRGVMELAAEVVASCTTDATPLPRRLYVVNDGTEGAA
jgi:AmiR/NasT family two-component response regulator